MKLSVEWEVEEGIREGTSKIGVKLKKTNVKYVKGIVGDEGLGRLDTSAIETTQEDRGIELGEGRKTGRSLLLKQVSYSGFGEQDFKYIYTCKNPRDIMKMKKRDVLDFV